MVHNIPLAQYIDPTYYDFLDDFFNSNHKYYSARGGRGSLKSTVGAELAVIVVSEFGSVLVVRQVYEKVKKTVYREIIKVINRWGLKEYFKISKSPLEITHIPTGNVIMFAGMDDPENVKGTTTEVGYGFALLLIDEAQQTLEDDIRSVRQTLGRGYTGTKATGWRFKTLYLSNPARAATHYTNHFKTTKHHLHLEVNYDDLSLYVQKAWLGQDFLDEADALREQDEELYNFEYHGKGMASGLVFKNIKEFDSSNVEIKQNMVLLFGFDHGTTDDPTTVIKVFYNPLTREAYIMDEYYKSDTDTFETADAIKSKGWQNSLINADNASPDAIRTLKRLGIANIVGVEGKTRVDDGIDWCRKLKAIYIDKVKTPHAYTEFTEYDKVVTKQGNVIYSTKNNHLIDAFRYALHSYIKGVKG